MHRQAGEARLARPRNGGAGLTWPSVSETWLVEARRGRYGQALTGRVQLSWVGPGMARQA